MLGFAIVDREPNGLVTIWLTSRVQKNALDVSRISVDHTNAVVLLPDDPDRDEKIRSLLADRIVVTTDETTTDGRLESALRLMDLELLVDEASAAQDGLTVTARASLPQRPSMPERAPGERSNTVRTHAAAIHVAQTWAYWLATADKVRARDKSKDRPADLPPMFTSRFEPEPIL